MVLLTRAEMAQKLDSTYLTHDSDSESRVRQLCEEALLLGVRAVCIRPTFLPLAQSVLSGSAVGLATVVGFPDTKSSIATQKRQPAVGVVSTAAKTHAIGEALAAGATELDVVINTVAYTASMAALANSIYEESLHLVRACDGRLLKVIFECDLLTPLQQQVAFDAATQAGVTCLKNATGFLEDGVGATVAVVSRMKTAASKAPQLTLVKASGGIRDVDAAVAMASAGADIIGTSAAKAICDGLSA